MKDGKTDYTTPSFKWQEEKRKHEKTRKRIASALRAVADYGDESVKKRLTIRAARMGDCMSLVHSLDCPQGHHSHIVRANACKDRLCPYCNSRRSHLLAAQLHNVLAVAQERHNPRFLFLTLTVRNCDGDKLAERLHDVSAATTRLFKMARPAKHLLGYVRTIEVTYNTKSGQYHPHVHVLLALESSYFHHGYISQSDWRSLWERAARLNFDPFVDVRVIRPKAGRAKTDVLGAAQEVASYSIKPSNFAAHHLSEMITRSVVRTYAAALRGVRLISFSGILKAIHAELKQAPIEESISTDGMCFSPSCPICGQDLVSMIHREGLSYVI